LLCLWFAARQQFHPAYAEHGLLDPADRFCGATR